MKDSAIEKRPLLAAWDFPSTEEIQTLDTFVYYQMNDDRKEARLRENKLVEREEKTA